MQTRGYINRLLVIYEEITMLFYRTLLATVAAVMISSPIFADDTTTTTQQSSETTTSSATSATESSTAATAKVNVNNATAKQLMKVKGLNAAKARAIVAYRKKHGDFKSLDDLKQVPGFKKLKANRLQAIEDQLSVD